MSASAQAARSLELVRPLAFFDLETTGIDDPADRIAEIAVLKLRQRQNCCPPAKAQT
jgi:uncharacterized protein YprB with RNaseH-like and TPR domain